jgi:hypothetical protein
VIKITHDWADEQALFILKAIRQKAPVHARLLLIKQLIAEDGRPT